MKETAFELGYAYSKGKDCCGLKTDPRQLLKMGDNPMISASLNKVFNSTKDLLEWASTATKKKWLKN
jgi:nucleoside 2-deoxyribosyltransferase